MSSRFGTQIVNRDSATVGTHNNYFFPAAVTSLARLAYAPSPNRFAFVHTWRYAGLENGDLYRRNGDTQGEYFLIYSGLSGQPFDSIVTNCFETSQAYLFIADQAVSLKDDGLLDPPQLWGIDPPTYTANAAPYSPLLTLIDNFASGNTYTTSGLSSAFTYSLITTIDAGSAVRVTDFYEFISPGPTIAGGSATSTQTTLGSNTATTIFSGFPSVAITPGQTVTVSVPTSGSATYSGAPGGGSFGNSNIGYFYSTDSGVTWTYFFAYDATSTTVQTVTFAPQTSVLVVGGLANLDTLQIKVQSISGIYVVAGIDLTSVGAIGTITASVADAGFFGDICNGILSVLSDNATIDVPIVSIVSSGFADGSYTTLTITTGSPHGLTGKPMISVYGSSNDLVDGYYTVSTTISSATQLIVPFLSVNAIGASGGFLFGGAAAPAECILSNEYAAPYPTQFSAWGFYEMVPPTTTAFPVGCFSGAVATNTNGIVGNTINLDLNLNNQSTDDDLIVITLKVGTPANIENIRLQFDVNGSGYTSAYYYKDISPAYYQGGVDQSQDAYSVTQSQILADTLGLITGQTPGTTAAQVQPGNFSTGSDAWVAVYLRRGDFLPIGQAGQSGLDWTNITGWQLEITTNTTGGSTFAVNGLYFQWGYGPSSFGGVGYDYRYTYYNANTGTESSPSAEMAFGGTQFGYLSSQVAPIYLRQAVQITGPNSTDPQVTHIRIYRRGGTLNSNWVQIDQIPNNGGTGGLLSFTYKDVIPDAFIEQAPILVLDNDPPVTSSLLNPIQTSLSAATIGPGNLYYSLFSLQPVTVADNTAVFVPNQIVEIGNAANLELVTVITGGTGTFTAIVRLQHNQGEQVNVYAVPRQPCNLCAIAYDQMWLAGDPNNPHYLYFSKKGLPENFGPQNYIPVTTPDDPINAVINWRGTLIVGTLKTWFIIVGGSSPYPQPTGSEHGIVAQQGWTQVEGAIWYQAADGLREFTGADGIYKSLPVEWIFRGNPELIPPQADPAQFSQSILAYYNNVVYTSYVSVGGLRYRLAYDCIYQRYRYDDLGATAMLWEKDTNAFLLGKPLTQSSSDFVVAYDQIGDYDDGGWVGFTIAQNPITLVIQSPYRDLGKPHELKQFNGLETDCNTQNQQLTTTLLFEDGAISIPLANINTGTTRQKAESIVNLGSGQEAYRVSILHTMAVTVAPTLFQECLDAALLPPEISSYDSYEIKMGTDLSKFFKQGWFDYTSDVPINVSLYADGSYPVPYWTFQLPAQPTRGVIRSRFSNLNSGTTAFTMRTWRMIMLAVTDTDPLQTFQLWRNPRIEWKIAGNNSYQVKELEV